jgi:hypothetical protein
MAQRVFARPSVLLSAILLLAVVPSSDAKDGAKPEVRFAAALQLTDLPRLPGLGAPSADWRHWDSFFTFVVKRFGQELGPDLRDSLGEAFLDSRYQLTNLAVRPGAGQNPVPELFLDGWRRLSPIINKALPTLPKEPPIGMRVSSPRRTNSLQLGRQVLNWDY